MRPRRHFPKSVTNATDDLIPETPPETIMLVQRRISTWHLLSLHHVVQPTQNDASPFFHKIKAPLGDVDRMPDTENTPDAAALTVQLLSAYLANNTVPSEELSALIRSTRAALTEEPIAQPAHEPEPQYTPAVSVRKSLSSPKHIISLIDGKPYKTLKRHLTSHGLTPKTYRERYNLPSSYPMVAPEFSAMRQAIAEKTGLGNSRTTIADKTLTDNLSAAPTTAAATETAPPTPDTAGAEKTPPAAAPKARSRKSPAQKSDKQPATGQADSANPEPKKAKGRAVRQKKDVAVKPVETPPTPLPAPELTVTTPAPVAKRRAKKEPALPASAPTLDAIASVPQPLIEAPAPAQDIPAKIAPQRRGKLGLFGRGATPKGETGPVNDSSAPQLEGDAIPAQKAKSRNAPKRKRMARTPRKATPES